MDLRFIRETGGFIMYEKRRSKRLPIELKLEISSLFRQDNVKVSNIHEPIEVFDISRTGIGFRSKSDLPLDFYFNAKLNLGGDDSSLYCVVKIIRRVEAEDSCFVYGCEFIGMAPVLSYIFDEYEKHFEPIEEWEK